MLDVFSSWKRVSGLLVDGVAVQTQEPRFELLPRDQVQDALVGTARLLQLGGELPMSSFNGPAIRIDAYYQRCPDTSALSAVILHFPSIVLEHVPNAVPGGCLFDADG